MKFTAIILLTACLAASGKGHSQSVTLSFKDAPLEKVFSEIEKQTGFSFIYYKENLLQARKVSLEVRGEKLEAVLTLLFKNQPLSYTISGKYIAIKQKDPFITPKELNPNETFLTTIDISGKVTDNEGNPLAGASVKVKGTTIGTTTNADGSFILKGIDDDATLEISFAEYETVVVKVNKRSSINVELKQEIGKLNEVVVNRGYYTEKKITQVGNVTKVKGSDIQKQVNADPIVALQGRVPGLFISQSNGYAGGLINQIRLRGQNSIANGNNPLFVVDGVPFTSTTLTNASIGGGASTLSPFTNINQSDIESIEVLKDADATAIYGSRGANGVILITTRKGKEGKTSISVDFNTGFTQVGHKLDLLNTEQYLGMRKEAFFTNDGLTTASPQYATAYDINGKWDTTRYTDWQNVLIGGTGRVTNAQVSLSGGNANTQFLIGSSYRKETTVLPGDFRDERISFHTNISNKALNDKLTTTFSAMYSTDNNLLPSTDFSRSILLAPNAPAIYDSAGNINWQGNTWDNPFATLLQTSKSITSNLNSSLNIGYKIMPNLELSTRLGFNTIQMDQSIISPMNSFSPSFASPAQRSNKLANNKIKTLIAEPQLSYNYGFSKAKLNFIIGSTFQQTTQQTISSMALNFSSDQLINNPSAATTVAIFNYSNSLYRLNSFFGRANFNWNEKYLINLTGRRDGSSRFGPGKQFGNFGAIGAGWVFSKESFFKNISFLSNGKIRASYGSTGNEPGQDYKYLSLYAPFAGVPYQDVIGLNPTNLSDPNFRWEIVKKLELGIDLAFFQQRLFFSTSYYRNKTSNQIVDFPLSTVTGFSGITTNLPAIIENKGLELEVNAAIIKARNFQWNSSFNLTIPKNKLVSFPNLASSPSYKDRYEVGKSLFLVKGYHYTGVDPLTGVYTFLDVNSDNRISRPQDLQGIKERSQKYFGGFQNSFSYKGFQLDILFQFVNQTGFNWGQNFTRAGQFLASGGNQPFKVLDRWRKPGDITDVQKFSSSNSAVTTGFSNMRSSDYVIGDASFIRMKNISFSYQFLPNLISKAHIQGLRIYVRGDNLFTITKYLGLDPETQSLALPPLRMISGGIQITF